MLEPRHIMKLKVDSTRVREHLAMPPPAYVAKPLIAQFAALNDAILTELLGIDPETFRNQLADARKRGTEYITDDRFNKPVGLSVSTSLVKTGDIMKKHLIIPCEFLRFDKKLSNNIMIGAFIRGETGDGNLKYDPDNIAVVGWTTASDIRAIETPVHPPMFQTKLNVIMVPCQSLRPMETLHENLASGRVQL